MPAQVVAVSAPYDTSDITALFGLRVGVETEVYSHSNRIKLCCNNWPGTP
jgi:hypothetical protein